MKILYVITGLGLGGAEKQLSLLADNFTARGEQVSIVYLTGEVLVKPKNKNIKIYNLGIDKSFSSLIKGVWKLKSIISDIRPDVINSHMYHASILARISCCLALYSSRLVCSAHSKNEGGRVRMLIYRMTDFLCAKTTNVSQEALDEFITKKAFRKRKSSLVYNGIDLSIFKKKSTNVQNIKNKLGINFDEKVIFCAGRLTEAKDYPNLILAISKMHQKKCKIIIAGDGPMRSDIERLIDRCHLSHRILLIGIIDNISDYYNLSDLFVLPSRWEGFGLVVAEAMACECPVIATDAGGVAEVLSNADWLVPIADSSKLAEKIDEFFLLDSSEVKDIKAKNKDHCENQFSIGAIINNWYAIYNGIRSKL
ncbi:glycosyltransferase [Edwardsiella ictaluri]|uniref:glycosyltransferase n=1 Tax=Edwardsiella ictaluri TaxID=67780 RepID=UPI0018DCDEA8|nr:glycosyltransferase [Edwardsiella ictaluri]QPW29646.1 glycosyltransferase [Edwardsiella ictaluri]WJH20681.1 glycosyltransferase [Edwardsiella ictaluri]BEH98436.1 glycosyltransferase [Edwardsiella ictaluri]BEI01935.1 glycosyltransferase [Edwardsiella ictaluri]BEI05403.1 glycosyltransferase [Edwardsiella ictaluri]